MSLAATRRKAVEGVNNLGIFFLLISMFEKHETIFGLCLGLLDLVDVFLLFLVSR